MSKLSNIEKEAIRHSQKKADEYKKMGGEITCPFCWSINLLKQMGVPESYKEICEICHKWMGTSIAMYSHPCNDLPDDVIKRRFWRDPDDEYLIGK